MYMCLYTKVNFKECRRGFQSELVNCEKAMKLPQAKLTHTNYLLFIY